MKLPGLPSWLNGKRTNVWPEPSLHAEWWAKQVVDYVQDGGRIRLVALPPQVDADVPIVNGCWPFITKAQVVEGDEGPMVSIEVEDRSGWAYYMNPEDFLTVAPGWDLEEAE